MMKPKLKLTMTMGSFQIPLLLVSVLTALIIINQSIQQVAAVRAGDFKQCKDSSFCRRIRRLSDYVESRPTFKSPYSIGKSSSDPAQPTFHAANSTLVLPIQSALHPKVEFQLQFHFHQDGTARVRMDQIGEKHKGWRRYDQADVWAIENQPKLEKEGSLEWTIRDGQTLVSYGPSKSYQLHLQHSPLKATFSRDGIPQVILNKRGLLHMEHFRPKPDPFPTPNPSSKEDSEETQEEKEPKLTASELVFQNRKRDLSSLGHPSQDSENWAGFEVEDEGEWNESFNGKPDSKPKGPEALSLDITFPNYSKVYGIPEHASPLNLRSTKGEKEEDFKEPYRLMNTDVFEYDYDSPMSLYGSVPVMHAQGKSKSASIFWLNAAETWIDIERKPSHSNSKEIDTSTHWLSESGILDLFIFLEKDPKDNLQLFTGLVGRTALPQYFAIGYHQCRWNYLTTEDVISVNERFDSEDIPMDVIWLDIEYSKDHMYGVWDEVAFPKPERMLESLDSKGRKLVIIIDPHLKRTSSYYLYDEAQKKELLVKNPDRKTDYEGWCWSGSASWLDMFNPKSWEWWSEQFRLKLGKLKANARNLHIWNDMNEPAIFNGPEITSPKDVIHHGGWEHRDIHNINSIVFHNATARGLKERETPNRRPFVLSRAWWVGTQKYGAIWTGDNLGTWEHLAVSVPMILANNIAGMGFCGADIGGFFGNPTPDMLVRWYQAGIFEPFFRAHAHIDTKRREPYLLEEPLRSAVRDLIKLRYKMLPAWYTAFKESADSGLPILRPQYLMFPDDEGGFEIDDQYYIGDTGLLVKPAVEKDATSVDVYLAEDQPYYNYFSHEVSFGSATGKAVSVPAPLTSELPLLHRGGSILPLRERVRRSAELGWKDPITLITALNKPSTSSSLRAEGYLYLDDGQTYDFEKGDFIWRRFEFQTYPDGVHSLKSSDEHSIRQRTRSSSSSTSIPAQETGLVSYDPENNGFSKAIHDVRIEKVVILGLDKSPEKVTVDDKDVEFSWMDGTGANGKKKKGKSSELILKDPKVLVWKDWEIKFD